MVLDATEPGIRFLAGALPPSNVEADSVAVLNAKLDDADAVDDAVLILLQVIEELTARGVIPEEEIPEQPPVHRVEPDPNIRRYIKARSQRASSVRPWIAQLDDLLRARGVAVLNPAPTQDRADGR